MAAQRKIFKTGHSAAVTISTGMLKALGLKLGDVVKVELGASKNEIIIRQTGRTEQLPLALKLRPTLRSPK